MPPKNSITKIAETSVETDQSAVSNMSEQDAATLAASDPSGSSVPDGTNTGPADGEDQVIATDGPTFTEGHDLIDTAAAASSVPSSATEVADEGEIFKPAEQVIPIGENDVAQPPFGDWTAVNALINDRTTADPDKIFEDARRLVLDRWAPGSPSQGEIDSIRRQMLGVQQPAERRCFPAFERIRHNNVLHEIGDDLKLTEIEHGLVPAAVIGFASWHHGEVI